MIAQVREAKLQKWVYGLGVSTDTGFRFSVDHTHNRVPYPGLARPKQAATGQKNPLLSTRITSLPDYSGWNYFVGGKAAREELADYTANSVSLVAGRGKSEDKIDRGYYLQYDMAKAQGEGTPPSKLVPHAQLWLDGPLLQQPDQPYARLRPGLGSGRGQHHHPERKPFGRMAARWLYLMPLDRAEGETGRRSRLAFRPMAVR